MNNDINLHNAIATNKKISDLYKHIKEDQLILQPDFQRKFVWNVNHRKQLIETILRGLPFPEIYIADKGVDIDTITSQEVVVDGQQRLTSIVQYIDGDLKLSPVGDIRPFKELDLTTKRKFLNYKVAVRELTDVDALTIKEIFRRINFTKYALNTYEIHNAIYDGEFISTAKHLLNDKLIQQIDLFATNENGRMQELGLILLLMSTIEQDGFFNGDSEVETYLKKYNDEYPEQAQMEKRIKKIAKIITELKLDPNSIWFRRSNLFSLFIFLARKSPSSNLKNNLESFEKSIIENKDIAEKENNDFSLYYFYTVAGTNSRKARVTRDEILQKYL